MMIALIDCNNFYCSCERVFQPSLLGRALIVLSNNDGCAIARSEEAKSLGINMGTPHFMITDLIEREGVAVRSSNYALYGDMSERVMEVVRAFAPRTEVYSIDELFADLSNMPYHDLAALARSLRKAVVEVTGIPVTVGIAPTKTLAKLANRYAKKNRSDEGLFVAGDAGAIQTLLQSAAVGDVWGIGPEHAGQLRAQGVESAAQLIALPDDWLRRELHVTGLRTVFELRGIPAIPWVEEPPAKKNICTARSFGQLVRTKRELRGAVARFTASCAEKMRREKTCARELRLFIQTNPHRYGDAQYFQSVNQRLTVPTSNTAELLRYAMSGLEQIFRPGYNYHKAGVLALDLVPEGQRQLGLFEGPPATQQSALMEAVDAINQKHGRERLRFATQGYEERWKLRQERRSAGFTTKWDGLPEAG